MPSSERDFAVRAFARVVHPRQLRLHLRERLAHRAQQVLGVLHEVRAIFLERVFGQRRERVPQLRLGLDDDRALLVERLARGLEFRLEPGRFGREPRLPQEQDSGRKRRPDDHARERRGEECGHVHDCTPRCDRGGQRADRVRTRLAVWVISDGTSGR